MTTLILICTSIALRVVACVVGEMVWLKHVVPLGVQPVAWDWLLWAMLVTGWLNGDYDWNKVNKPADELPSSMTVGLIAYAIGIGIVWAVFA